jgi:hypothetical protein
MSLTKTEKVNILNGLSDNHKEKIAKAIIAAEKKGMAGTGIMDGVKGLGKGLLEILKVVGPTLAKEILLPLIKAKLAGSGLKLAGQKGKGVVLAGGGKYGECAPTTGAPVAVKRGRGRPKKAVVM